jgi:hypothetical protein
MSVARMKRYGERGHPCLTDLARGKVFPSTPLSLMADEADLYKELTHLIHCGQKPSFARASNRKLHSILSKVFSKSRSRRTRSWLLSSAQSWASYAKKVLSRMLDLSMKLVWPGLIMLGRKAWSLLARILARILYRLPSKVIVRQFPSLAWSPDLGIKVMSPLLNISEVSPFLSIAEKAWRRVGEISSTNS